MLRVNATVAAIHEPPVTAAKAWIADREFPANMPLLDLSQAVPGYPPAASLRRHLAEVVQRPETSRYAPVLGLAPVRRAVAAHLNHAYGAAAAITVDDVMITSGCNQAFCLAIGALCEPGDEVVLPTPHYFNHDMWLRACGVRPVPVMVDMSHGMAVEPAAIEAAITGRTRAVVLVTPNNPCGVVSPPTLIDAVFEIARRHGIALILDETYKDFRATVAAPHALFTRVDWNDTLVHLFSFSKMLSLPGYRVGSLTAAPHVLVEAAKLADCETIGAPRVAQEAVSWGLVHLDDWVETNRRAMCDRVERLERVMSSCPGGFEVVASGAFFAYVRHPFEDEHATAVARRLADDHNLLTIPGESFGRGQDRFLRLAFGNVDDAGIDIAADRLAAAGSAGLSGGRHLRR